MDTSHKGEAQPSKDDLRFRLAFFARMHGARDLTGFSAYLKGLRWQAAVFEYRAGSSARLAEMLLEAGIAPVANMVKEHRLGDRSAKGRPPAPPGFEHHVLAAAVDRALSIEAEWRAGGHRAENGDESSVHAAAEMAAAGHKIISDGERKKLAEGVLSAAEESGEKLTAEQLSERIDEDAYERFQEKVIKARHGGLSAKDRATPLVRRVFERRDLAWLSGSLANMRCEILERAAAAAESRLRVNAVDFLLSNFGWAPPDLGADEEIDLRSPRDAAADVLRMLAPRLDGRRTSIRDLHRRWGSDDR